MAGLVTGNKFDPNKDIPDLSGKVYVVTGGSAGIGYGIVAHLLQHNPSKIYLLSNKEEHANEAQEGLKNWGDNTKVEWRQCNLESLKQTDEVTRSLAKDLDRLDGLVCNAGLGVGVYNESVEDGLDTHMQKTTDSRIVFQSSDVHKGAPSSIAFESINEMNQDIGPTNLYARTKLAQILFARELVTRIKNGQFGQVTQAQGLPFINAVHPGGVLTDQPNQAIEAYGTPAKIAVKAIKPFMKSPEEEGCRPALFAVASESVAKETIQAAYIVPDRKITEPSNQAKDEKLAQNLWKLTKEVLETKIGNVDYTM
ncbi:hypothetical protein LTR70_001430 [Exophiala xenobiotica]|uniref:NAD(P)-binding protein n=1 Tax=Lithohypha guttulata TaxID=1690604 RepID=A0ABR0KMJ9_9EURO|nr:hypothetical protein LTR24_000816 [Lithohypha guttulata]KAK5328109.1 hypothetical protein LTR70_001430 [Exophiala xenobiotica]